MASIEAQMSEVRAAGLRNPGEYCKEGQGSLFFMDTYALCGQTIAGTKSQQTSPGGHAKGSDRLSPPGSSSLSVFLILHSQG